ncbi:diguanylate cyclase (GGDEF)-like protein/PAS domain S-box-containing protein [Desulfobaculum xiamenense]|uniref:Diguanylate cyclase (GGDEF)-like protein/PAS domain S-box-containing protein n=1 Tax=Desulfobaculum xiamenense TaxID=995050 RepID=A0A846QSB6_9BACT|nr:EAL domain-containing protein [Desulfobaculum xiamenense]NJB69263.1 diguanylate cyclase (GGDEF)-like protein/PAS domain S-box-containing protein [Desulfobaculum xiamenense]
MKTIRAKISAVVAVVSLFMLLSSLGVAYVIYADGFADLERRDVLRNLTRARNALDAEIGGLTALCRDWAWWDDTYDFMSEHDEEYVSSNLAMSTFDEQRLEFILYIDRDGALYEGRVADVETGKFRPLPQHLNDAIRSGRLLVTSPQSGEGVSGLLILDGHLYIVSSQSILTSDLKGPGAGVLVMGRRFGPELVRDLAARTRLHLDLRMLNDPTLPEDMRKQAARPGHVEPVEDGMIRGVVTVADLYGTRSLLLAVTMPREVYGLGMSVLRYHLAGIAVSVLIMAVLSLLLLDRLVVSRLAYLSGQVAGIAASSTYVDSVDMAGEDEIGSLAMDINRMLAQLRENEQFFGQILHHLRVGVVIVDESTLVVMEINPHALSLLGLSRTDVVGHRCRDVFCPTMGAACPLVAEHGVREAEEVEPLVRKVRRSDDVLVSVVKTAASVTWKGRRCILETLVDVTELEAAQTALREAEELYRTVFMNTGSASILIDDDTTIRLVNPEFEKLVGRGAAEVEGKVSWMDIFHEEDVPRMLEFHRRRRVDPMSVPRVYESRLYDRQGNVHDVSMTVALVPGERVSVAAITDITEHKKAEARLVRQAFYDELTDLPNRQLLMERLQRAIDTAHREGGLVGLLLLDLDDFKLVNDNLGHSSGDRVLRMVADRLCEVLRRKDTVARIGGDEFLVLVDDAHDTDTFAHLATAINDRFSKPFRVQDSDIYLGFSIGISVYPDDGSSDPEGMVRNADMAMYQAKRTGRNSFSMFTADLNERAMKRLSLEGELRTALDHRNFVVHYQPQVDLVTGEVAGAEALVRWMRPDGTMVPPGDFIPVAEETGLVVPLDLWVMEEAVRRAVVWREEGVSAFKVSVNLSARHFATGNLVEKVEDILTRAGLPPSQLGVEVTETLLMQNMQAAVDVLTRLSGLGVRVLLDDFGTGYSSLAYLSRLPIDTLKIDRSFVLDISGGDSEGDVVARGILSLAANLGLTVVAEGVETMKQVDFLKAHGCPYAQGYLFSKPLPHMEFRKLFQRGSIFPSTKET